MQDQNNNRKKWEKLFLFCFGIALATAFCMKWMEKDLLYQGKLFTVIGLELSYPQDKVAAILSGIDPSVHQVLTYHLSFDFMFMMGVFPGVAAFCMMGRTKISHFILRRILLSLAFFQFIAWGCDIFENLSLLTWMKNGTVKNFETYHFIVYTKWILVCAGIAFAIIPLFLQKKILHGTNQEI